MSEENKKNWTRRDVLKGIAGAPIVGAVWWSGARKTSQKSQSRESILKTLNIKASPPPPSGSVAGDPVRIGVIGFGIRGPQLCRAIGFAQKSWLTEQAEAARNNSSNTQLSNFLEQEDLNVQVTAVCDVFDIRAEDAVESFSTDSVKVKRYKTYLELLESADVDAVIIATPDHWHAPMAIAALKAGKHVYVEKPMTHNIKETYELKETAENTDKVFAVGHQHRQTQSFLTAQDVIEKNILGHVSLIQANTNRNDDNGAWQYHIHEKASPSTIDWDQFIGNAPMTDFNLEHFFRWRKWWAYGSGLSGDLLSHDYDRINCVLRMGIPNSVTASGGIYTHRDGRNVPDVFQTNMEFSEFLTGSSQPEGKVKGMTLVYSATLGNNFGRKTLLMGHDATMDLGNSLSIYVDRGSTRFKEEINNGTMEPGVPIYTYDPSLNEVDGISSATTQYFADKGLLWTYRDGKRVDSTHLHLREWLSCIRNGGTPSCDIKAGFEEAITSHMAGLSYKLGRRIDWDNNKYKLVPISGIDFDEALLTNKERV
ncbi:MAG: Gfo/Idh/MocA family oxidoreductase [Balneolaceae bacterium]|nr:Gfo/Idh/MocA family oxidoreductase [Balneolaceae bacterium]MBO6545644.1 Gfo/Idh/MocA family oxidoreductase [Balneolaceae bacterium]MBO6647040.1 Gfo/Idh/MocA family oxidoreductase [Balneolaceae bacterium]